MSTPKNKRHSSKVATQKLLQTIGPVENLETYVKADWWREIFNANYLRTDGDVVEDITLTQKEVDLFLEMAEPARDSAILDLCCGQGRHISEIARRGFKNLTGLDRSHYLINRARVHTKKEGLEITFKEGDVRKLPFQSDSFDIVIIAGNSFGYFDVLQDDIKVLLEVMRTLKPEGHVIIDIADGDYLRNNYQARSWEWINKNYLVCRERMLSEDGNRLISREVITHTRKGVTTDQFYAERLYSREAIVKQLSRTGFSDAVIHSDLITQSERNQDLGMMEKRILLSAIAKKEWTRIPSSQIKIKSVMVVMGDYRKTDRVKPSGSFDADDFHTINELKKALRNLKGFRFTYLDNHDTLLQDLKRSKDKVDLVFNLCDEGFDNDARKELHVPAILEILGIKYTGGNPQCLAFCYDKSLVRGVAKEMDIPVPLAFTVDPAALNFIELPIGFPVIVKPNFGDSSFGINVNSVCYSIEQLEKSIIEVRTKFGYEKPVLVEQYLTGADISVGFIGNPPDSYTTLPVIEEDYSSLPEGLPHICGYEAKWDPDSPYANLTSKPANLPEDTERYLIASCIRLFERLECRDYARFDWRLDQNGTPRLLEVNPNQGWCWDGHLAKMSSYTGWTYEEMLKNILLAAMDRCSHPH